MSYEILSAKLNELDDSISRLHERIQDSQNISRDELQTEIADLQQECEEQEQALRDRLQNSRSEWVHSLSAIYDQVETIIMEANRSLKLAAPESFQQEASSEEQLLLAEYILDFALQAANRALLASLEAINTQLSQDKDES